MTSGSLQRLRLAVLVLTVALVFGAIAAPIGVVVYIQRTNASKALEIICVTAESNISELKAVRHNARVLDDIAHSLGLPLSPRAPIIVPRLPEECP